MKKAKAKNENENIGFCVMRAILELHPTRQDIMSKNAPAAMRHALDTRRRSINAGAREVPMSVDFAFAALAIYRPKIHEKLIAVIMEENQ